MLLGLVIGAFPLIYYNLVAPFSQNSLVVFWNLHSSSGLQAAYHLTFAQQIVGTLLVSLPVATGHSPSCTTSELPLFGPATANTVPCTFVQTIWGLGYIALLLIAMLLSVTLLWKLRHLRKSSLQGWTAEERQAAILHSARLMPLSAAAVAILLYADSPLAAFAPWPTSRYLVGLLIATPAVLWPLWNGIPWGKGLSHRSHKGGRGADEGGGPLWSPVVQQRDHQFRRDGRGAQAFRVSILLLIVVIFATGTINVFSQSLPSVETVNQQQDTFVHDLLHIGATRIYTDYWTCNRVVFQSNEQIICSVLGNDLKPTENRYTAYSATVSADPNAAYVFPANSPQAQTLPQQLAQSGKHYSRLSLDGFIIYQPTTKT